MIKDHADTIRTDWNKYLSPWWSWWQAGNAYLVREVGAAPEMGERIDAWQDACSAGMWWPHTDYVIVCERPTQIVHERVGPDGWGSHRLHNPHGPAIAWMDDWSIWCWHGTVVPAWVIQGPTLEQIRAEVNTEIRRCAIESYGWDRYLADLGVTPVDVAADPGNPGHELVLFDLPEAAQLYGEPVRLLVMSNASRDRDGSRRTFAETVPADCADAVSAAAWQFGVDPDMYRTLARAT